MNQKQVGGNSRTMSPSRASLRSKAADAAEERILAAKITTKKDECAICLEEFKPNLLATLDCKHRCCSVCLTEMFKSAAVDESRYPPKCCTPISIETVRSFITCKIVEKFEHKKVEWDTKNRTYCSDKDCGRFLRPDKILGTWASCPRCLRVTCTECKNVAHREKKCPEDEGTKQALGLMKKEGYKRCSKCQNGVELKYGCNHIYCICGSEFCYVCGGIWKTCSCPIYGNPNRNHIAMDGTYHEVGPQAGQAPIPLRLFPQARQFLHQQVRLPQHPRPQGLQQAAFPQMPQFQPTPQPQNYPPQPQIPQFQPTPQPQHPPQPQNFPQAGNFQAPPNMVYHAYGAYQSPYPQLPQPPPQAGYQYIYTGQQVIVPQNLMQNPTLARDQRQCDKLFGPCRCGLDHGPPPDLRNPFNGQERPA